jgi:hypothetical protein
VVSSLLLSYLTLVGGGIITPLVLNLAWTQGPTRAGKANAAARAFCIAVVQMARALQLYTDDQKRCLQQGVKAVFENTDSFLHEFLEHCGGINEQLMSDKSDSFSVLLSQINKDSLPGEDCAESVKTKMPTFEEVMSFLVSASSTRFLTMDNVVKHAVCLTIIAALGWPMVRDRRQQMADEAASDVHKDLWRGRSDLLGCEEAEGAEARWEHIQNYDLEEYYADQRLPIQRRGAPPRVECP